jgi:hypothetical protein
LLRVCIFALQILDRSSPTFAGSPGSHTTMQYALILMSVFETGLFVLGIVLFVLGLSALRREMDLPRSLPSGFRDD